MMKNVDETNFELPIIIDKKEMKEKAKSEGLKN